MSTTDTAYSAAFLQRLIFYIEKRLAYFYQFNLSLSAWDFLLDEDALEVLLEKNQHLKLHAHHAQQSGVWLVAENDHSVFIGMHLRPRLIASLSAHNPLTRLTHANLNDFCVLVEEISHFHLLVQRMQQGRTTSLLELEWQGEIDKILLAGALLRTQVGRPYLARLIHLICDRSVIVSPHYELYNEAIRYAAKFWLHLTRQGVGQRIALHSTILRRFLGENYTRPLHEKFPFTTHVRSVA